MNKHLELLLICNICSPGPRKGREVYRHFGKAPGTPHSHTKYVHSCVKLYFTSISINLIPGYQIDQNIKQFISFRNYTWKKWGYLKITQFHIQHEETVVFLSHTHFIVHCLSSSIFSFFFPFLELFLLSLWFPFLSP